MNLDDLVEILYRCAKMFVVFVEKKRKELTATK